MEGFITDQVTASFLSTLALNVATNVGSNLIYDVGKNSGSTALANLRPKLLEKAIEKVAREFPDFENLKVNLQLWVESENLRELAVKTAANGSVDGLKSVAENFVATTDFHSGENTLQAAEQILTKFFAELLVLLNEDLAFKQDVSIELGRQTLSELRSLKTESPNLLAREDGIVPTASELEFHIRIDAARSLIKLGNPRSALTLLQQLQEEVAAKSPSTDLLFRISLYTASAHFNLEQWDEAEKRYELSLRLRPENLKALVNTASFFGHRKLSDRALTYIEKAFSISPKDTLVRAIRLLIYHDLERIHEVKEELSAADLIDTIEGQEVLGQIAFDNKDFSTAIQCYEKVLDRDSKNIQAKMLKAQALLSPIEFQFDCGRSRQSPLSTEEVDDLQKADALLTEALTEQANQDSGILKARTLLLRAGARAVLSRFDDAVVDCESVPSDSPLHFHARKSKSAILILQGKQEEGQKILADLLSSKPARIEVIIPLSDIFLNKKELDRAIELLTPFIDNEYPPEFRFAAMERLLLAYWQQNDIQSCEGIIAQLQTFNTPYDAQAYAIQAIHSLRLNEFERADKLLNDAIGLASEPSQQELLRRKLLYARAVAGKFEQALETFVELKELSAARGEIAALAAEMYGNGKSKEALFILDKFREKAGTTPGVTEIEVNVLVSIGEFEKAKTLLTELAKLEPGNYQFQIETAALAWRLGQEATARTILENIDANKFNQHAEALLRFAYCWHSLGEKEKALPLAFRARRLSMNDPQVHMAYVDLFMHCAGDLKFDTVKVDTTVTIQRENAESLNYTIVKERDGLSDSSEIDENDPLAQRLLHKTIRNKIVLREDQFGKLEYEITAIRHKYVTAYQDSLTTFTARFPDSSGLRAIEDPSLVLLFAEVERHHARVSKAQKLYESRQIGFEMAARLAGINLTDFWLASALSGFGSIQAFEGTDEARESQPRMILESDGLVLDFTALLTVIHLQLEKELIALGKPLIISQFTFDEINVALFTQLEKPTAYVGKAGDRYTLTQASTDVQSIRRSILQKVRNFIRDHASITGVSKALDENTETLRQAYDVIGRASYSSLLLATESKRCLLADDIILRQLLKEKSVNSSACLYSVLTVMLQTNVLSEEAFTEKICLLANANYRFLPVRPADLIYPLEKVHGSINRTASTMMGLLADPSIVPENAGVLAAEFLRLVYFRIVIVESRSWIVRLLLRILARRRDRARTFAVLKTAVQNLFNMMPVQAGEIYVEIETVKATSGAPDQS